MSSSRVRSWTAANEPLISRTAEEGTGAITSSIKEATNTNISSGKTSM